MKKLLWYAVGLVIVVVGVISIVEPSIFGLGEKRCYGLGCEQGIEQCCTPPDTYSHHMTVTSICDSVSVCVTNYWVYCEDANLGILVRNTYLCLSSPLPGECGSK